MADYREGQTATNPKTGQKIVFKNGQWINAGPSGGAATAANPKDQQRLANLEALRAQIGRVAELYSKGPGATQGPSGLMDYLPTPGNRAFDSAGAGLGEVGLAAFRVPGVGSQSDAELKAFIQANRPSASDYDSQIEEKIGNLQRRLQTTYQSMGRPYKPIPLKRGKQSSVIDFSDLPE